MRVSAPTSSKPGLQEKVAVSPTKVPEKATEPLAGSTRIGQRARMGKGVVHSGAKIAPFSYSYYVYKKQVIMLYAHFQFFHVFFCIIIGRTMFELLKNYVIQPQIRIASGEIRQPMTQFRGNAEFEECECTYSH